MKKILCCLLSAAMLAGSAFAQDRYFDLNKKQYSYLELTKPEKTVLFIWAGWCPICRKELVRLAKDPSIVQGLNMVYLDTGESFDDVKNAVNILDLPQEMRKKVVFDPFEDIGNRFFISGVPTVIFLKNGVPLRTAHDINKELIYYVYGAQDKPQEPVGKTVKIVPAGQIKK